VALLELEQELLRLGRRGLGRPSRPRGAASESGSPCSRAGCRTCSPQAASIFSRTASARSGELVSACGTWPEIQARHAPCVRFAAGIAPAPRTLGSGGWPTFAGQGSPPQGSAEGFRHHESSMASSSSRFSWRTDRICHTRLAE
jgi:hypothetical protein